MTGERYPGCTVALSAQRFVRWWPGLLPLLIFVLVLAPTAARAEPASVSATLTESSTVVGEPVELRVTVAGGRPLGRVVPPSVEGLDITALGPSVTLGFGSSGITEQYTYRFPVTPSRVGTFTLPPVEVQIGTRLLRTRTLTLVVTAAGAAGGGGGGGGRVGAGQIRAELLIQKNTVFVGEAFPAEFRLSFGPRAELIEPDPNPQLAGEGFSVGRFTAPQLAGPRLGGGQRVAYKAVLTAAKAGTLTLGPTTVEPYVQLSSAARSRWSDPFDDPFGNQLFGGPSFSPPRQVKLRAAPVAVEVKPLPTTDQPVDFTGGIGRFELLPVEVVSPAPGSGVPAVRAGEPVTVRVAIRGQGNFDRLGAPRPEDAGSEGLRFYPPKDHFKASDDVGLVGTKFFDQTFIAPGPRDTVPGFHFAYFDPATETYQTVRTPPVPLKVLPGVTTTAAAPAASAPSEPAAMPGSNGNGNGGRAAATEDLRPIRPDPGVSVAWGAGWRFGNGDAGGDTRRSAFFWWAQLAPLAALLTLVGFLRARARRRDAAVQARATRVRERAALWRTLRAPHVGRREFFTAAVRLLDAAPPAAANIPEELAAEIESLRARHAGLAYGGEDAGDVSDEERAEVRAVLKWLEEPADKDKRQAAAAAAMSPT